MLFKKQEAQKTKKAGTIGAMLGGAVGAGLGLLFAPKAGKRLRKDIADAASDATSSASKLFEKAKPPRRRLSVRRARKV